MIKSLICLARTIYRTIKTDVWMDGMWVSGHDYKTVEEKTPPNVHIVRCMVCNKQDISWSWDSIEHLK